LAEEGEALSAVFAPLAVSEAAGAAAAEWRAALAAAHAAAEAAKAEAARKAAEAAAAEAAEADEMGDGVEVESVGRCMGEMGDGVEVAGMEEGFFGSWDKAAVITSRSGFTLVRPPTLAGCGRSHFSAPGLTLLCLRSRYEYFGDADGSRLEDWVETSRVRPLPPHHPLVASELVAGARRRSASLHSRPTPPQPVPPTHPQMPLELFLNGGWWLVRASAPS